MLGCGAGYAAGSPAVPLLLDVVAPPPAPEVVDPVAPAPELEVASARASGVTDSSSPQPASVTSAQQPRSTLMNDRGRAEGERTRLMPASPMDEAMRCMAKSPSRTAGVL